jgi:hypothetical protein
MKIEREERFEVAGFPIAVLEGQAGELGVFDGEGGYTLFDRHGRKIGQHKLDPVGFSGATSGTHYTLLERLSGGKILASLRLPIVELPKHSSHFIEWNDGVFFNCGGRLFTIHEENPQDLGLYLPAIDGLHLCKDQLLVRTKEGWFSVDPELSVRLLTSDWVPVTGGAYLEENRSFHFVLPHGEMGLIDLAADTPEFLVSNAAGSGLKCLGPVGNSAIAFLFHHEIFLLVKDPETTSGYATIVSKRPLGSPMKALASPDRFFVTQDDLRNLSAWNFSDDFPLWMSEFEDEICETSLSRKSLTVALKSGTIHRYFYQLEANGTSHRSQKTRGRA